MYTREGKSNNNSNQNEQEDKVDKVDDKDDKIIVKKKLMSDIDPMSILVIIALIVALSYYVCKKRN
jgi:alpha-L-arabinofuranosidase